MPKADIGEPHVNKSLQFSRDSWDSIEEIAGVFDCHFENFVDVLSFVGDLQGLPVIALALTDITGDIYVRQKVHLHLDHTVTLTCLAATSLNVERESSGFVTTATSFLCAGKQLSHGGKDAGVSRWIGSRCAADRALINIHDFV